MKEGNKREVPSILVLDLGRKPYIKIPLPSLNRVTRFWALLLSLGYYGEIIKISIRSFDYGPGVLVFGALFSLLANIGIWLITFPLVSWWKIVALLLFAPAYVVGSFVAFHYHTLLGVFTLILLGVSTAKFLRSV